MSFARWHRWLWFLFSRYLTSVQLSLFLAAVRMVNYVVIPTIYFEHHCAKCFSSRFCDVRFWFIHSLLQLTMYSLRRKSPFPWRFPPPKTAVDKGHKHNNTESPLFFYLSFISHQNLNSRRNYTETSCYFVIIFVFLALL